MEKISSYNNEVLKWARIYSKTSHEEVLKRLGSDKYLKWEQKLLYPTFHQLEVLFKLYRLPIAVLFLPEPPPLLALEYSFRTLPELMKHSLSKDIIKMINDARVYQLDLEEL